MCKSEYDDSLWEWDGRPVRERARALARKQIRDSMFEDAVSDGAGAWELLAWDRLCKLDGYAHPDDFTVREVAMPF